ncbi:class I SAM-dependent methyltransferase [Haloarchaeobius sp. HRN-SO-5]|uniref:class I SAM-dependent methyltransferase n=1 Tax=Haloarchaeobius sp. HRN-SO-5 TaxID=3446118 RepID=UPI003EB90677
MTSHDGSTDSDGHRLFAALYDPVVGPFESRVEPHRRWLATGCRGTVLAVGVGTGAMFPYFAEVSRRDPTVEFVGIEPDPHMRKRAEPRARECGLDITIHDAGAEAIPLPDDSVDVVVASLVFCTIPDVDAAIDEVARVLEPGGEFRFFEHVRAKDWTNRIQQAATPVWKRVAGGCHLDRATDERFIADDRFEVQALERLDVGVPPVEPFVRGVLVRNPEQSLEGQ